MTEDEAKGKWCPMVRLFDHYDAPGAWNRIASTGEGANCIGSGCMMWRWEDSRPVPGSQTGARKQHGHCGLAGKP